MTSRQKGVLPFLRKVTHCSGGDTRQQRQDKTHPEMGCEFALPFVFPPYFADTYGGKEERLLFNILPFYVDLLDKTDDFPKTCITIFFIGIYFIGVGNRRFQGSNAILV